MSSAAESMVEVLAAGGVRRAYTVPGESFLGMLEYIDRHSEMELISTRHESGASFAAEADAKLTRTPSVVMATRGVGTSNLAIGVHTARQDSTPMVAILGQVNSGFIGREGFQEIDLTAFYTPITKHAVTATRGDRLPELVANALRIAQSGRPGPVMIAVPSDLFDQDVSVEETASMVRRASVAIAAPSVDRAVATHISERLANARQPVVIAGGGARASRGLLISVAERYNVGVYAAFRRQDSFPNDHPLFLGHLGMGSSGSCLDALRKADVVLALGTRLSEITTQSYTLPLESSEIIQVDLESSVIGSVAHVDLGVVADCGDVLRCLLQTAPAAAPSRSWDAPRAAFEAWSALPEPRNTSGGIDPTEVIGAMARTIPEEAILVNDAGNFAAFLHRHWINRVPLSQLAPLSGAMGYAVPGALGAALADPSRPVVAVAGDGGFLMTGGELETAVRYGASIAVVVFSNGLYGTIAANQARAVGRLSGVEISRVDIAGYAKSLGADAVRVTAADELDDALAAAVKQEGVNVVEVRTDPDQIAPGGASLSAMLSADR